MDVPAAGIYNIAGSGEHLAYTFAKLDIALKQNIQIRQVVLEFSSMHLHPTTASILWEDQYITNKFPTWYPLMNDEDLAVIKWNEPNQLIKGYSSFMVRGLKKIVGHEFKLNKYGGYRKHIRIYRPAMEKEAVAHPQVYPNSWQSFTLNSLRRIIALCKQKNVHLIIVRSPVHPSMKEDKYETAYQNMLRNELANLPHYDYYRLSLGDSSFADQGHLNFTGAKKYTPFFVSQLQKDGHLN